MLFSWKMRYSPPPWWIIVTQYITVQRWPWPDGLQWGGAIFMIKQKYMRDNEIHVIVMICHTVSECHF